MIFSFTVAGCGGDHSAAVATQGTGTSEAEAPSTAGEAGPSAGRRGQGTTTSEESNGASGSGDEASAAAPAPPGSGRGKHGPKVPLPTNAKRVPKATPQQRHEATLANLPLYSPDFPGTSPPAIPTKYTCDGANTWPRISWGQIPSGTAELALLGMNSQPVENELFFDWAVAGIDPALSGLEAGKLPKGAVMGTNSFGHASYSICPSPGSPETYIFILYALPQALNPKPGFEPLAFREKALDLAHRAGLMAATYARG